MRKFYPVKFLLLLTFLVLLMSELSAQRTARKRVPAKYYLCGLNVGAVARDLVSTEVRHSTASFDTEVPESFDYVDVQKGLTGKLVCLNVVSDHTISGSVKDPDGNRIPFATVMMIGSPIGAAADENGNFTLTVPKYSLQGLTVSAVGYKTTSVQFSNPSSDVIMERSADPDTTLVPTVSICTIRRFVNEIILTPQEELMEDVTLYAPNTTVCGRCRYCCYSNVSRLCEFKTAGLPEPEINSFTIYPNPARSGSILTVEWKEAEGNYRWQLFDMSGRKISEGEVARLQKTGIASIALPSVTAGTYILNFTGKGNQFSKKILIID